MENVYWYHFLILATRRLKGFESFEKGSHPILSLSPMEFLYLLDSKKNCWWSLVGIMKKKKKAEVIEVGKIKKKVCQTQEKEIMSLQ